MANATQLAVTSLVGNGTASATSNTFDTATAAVTVYTTAVDEADRVMLRVASTATVNLTCAVLAGDNPPAFRQQLGALTKTGISSSAPCFLGPFEGARFLQNDGTIGVTLTPVTTAAIACTVEVFKLPKV